MCIPPSWRTSPPTKYSRQSLASIGNSHSTSTLTLAKIHHRSFPRYSTKWRDPLGNINVTRDHTIPDLPALAPGSDATLAEYIASLFLTWYRRLLFDFRQTATDLEMWRAFRSKRRLLIATDGSLLVTAGSFGWELTTTTHSSLFEGFGPVDGPIEIGSSTRSEIGGITAPLLLVITALVRYWGLKHCCKFRWIADSKVALS